MDITTKIYTYKEVYTANIKLYADGRVNMFDKCAHHVQGTINKMACINVSNDNDLASLLAGETSGISISPGSALYVASECKTARDTFRNSGYSITRSPEKADAIVIPDVNARYYYRLVTNMVAYKESEDNLYLFSIEKPGYFTAQLNAQDIGLIGKYLSDNGYEPCDVYRERIAVLFMPKCGEIRNILEGNTIANIPYIQESSVQIKASTQISPETLVFWEHIDDPNLLVRTICTSDWMEYPITLLAFLSCFKDNVNWYANANNDFRRILKSIGYEGYWSAENFFINGRIITPKDYDMLQSYIFYRLGIEEDSGMISAKTYMELDSAIRPLLMQKIAVKKMSIPTRMSLGNIKALANQ